MKQDLWNPALDGLVAYQVPDSSGLIKLDAMENPFPLPTAVAQAFAAEPPSSNRYPDASASALKTALEQVYPAPDGFGCVLGNGSDELIALLLQAVLRPGATVLAAEPCFVMYRHLAGILGLRFVGVPLQADFSLDMPAMLAAIEEHQPSLVFIASPNNPTGNLFPEAELKQLATACPGLFVLDEAYIPYAATSGGEFAAQHSNVVLLRTLSKWGLAGLRLGFVQARAEVCAQLEKLRMPYNINSLSQSLGRLCLQQGAEFKAQIEILVAERARLEAGLAAPGVQIYPSAANFLLLRVPDAPRTHAALKAEGVLVKILHGAHPLLQHCLRISLGIPEENTRLLAVWPGVL